MKLPSHPSEMKTAERAALYALLWSSTDDNGEPLDNGDYKPSPELVAIVARDWRRFIAAAEAAGFDADAHRTGPINPAEGDALDYAAYDFILTRNRHGAGFWDGNWAAPWGDRLTALSHQFGELELVADPETGEVDAFSDPDNQPGPMDSVVVWESGGFYVHGDDA